MKRPGSLITFAETIKGIELNTTEVKLLVQCITESTFRISSPGASEKHSYSVTDQIHLQAYTLQDSDQNILLSTSKLKLLINKAPVRFKFETPDGTVLSEDDHGLGIIWDEDGVTNYKTLQPGERFFGLGQKTGGLDKAGKQYRNWNTDAYGYTPSTDPLYISCPFFIGMSHARYYGIFLNNHSETTFNFGAANNRFSFFQARDGILDYFFFAGLTPADILKDYTLLTGRMSLPPLWSLGFQQCRYSYYPSEDITRVARSFREKQLPVDVIYFDIHYMQNYKVFTWHEEHFPKPEDTIRTLKELNFHPVIILDPGVKVEEGYDVYEEGLAGDVFLKYPDGVPYHGGAWPGWCHFPDFTRATVREWWAANVEKFAHMGIEGFWNDMNEPAVWGHHVPRILEFDMEGQGGTHREAHNIYGMQMARATLQGAKSGMVNQRPFILTRATFSGGQRDSAVWTGDNHANNEHLMLGAKLVAGMGLSGFPFTGNDIGGFTGDASASLYRRWIAQATFQPLMRAHSMINSKQAEPWSFGEETLEIVRNYLELRYKILPHLYSLFYEATQNGMPPVRSLLFEYGNEWKIFARSFEHQFMLGNDLLVCPIESEISIAKVYLPKGKWYHFLNDTLYEGGMEHFVELQHDTIPLFVKAGGILPMQNTVQHTNEPNDGILRLHIYFGSEGNYSFYEDDGVSYDYENGKFALRQMHLNTNQFEIDKQEGQFISRYHAARLYIHGFKASRVEVNGNAINISKINFRFMPAISNFDPYEAYPDALKEIQDLPYLDIEYTKSTIKIIFLI